MAGLKDRIKTGLHTLLDDVLNRDSRNIGRERQRQALARTAEFVDQHLPLAVAYPSRYAMYEEIARGLQQRTGLFCEFGVAAGKSINFLAGLFPNHTLHGFDSFEGRPEDWREGHPKGLFKVAQLPAVRPNVQLVKSCFRSRYRHSWLNIKSRLYFCISIATCILRLKRSLNYSMIVSNRERFWPSMNFSIIPVGSRANLKPSWNLPRPAICSTVISGITALEHN